MATSITSQMPVEHAPPATVPELHNGDRLTREEFHRRYEAMPHINKAELIEGVVYMPSPVRQKHHSQPHSHVVTWMGTYAAATPGTGGGANASLLLDTKNQPQPDSFLYILPECGGQVRINSDDYIVGAPDWIGEISASTVSIDLHDKLNAYRRNGAREYFVWRVLDQAIDWFILRGDRYELLPVDAHGVIRSEVFPGLWLDPTALLAGDLKRVLAVVQEGVKAPEHEAFVNRLNAARTQGERQK
jgi:hypothetical protein